MTTLITKKPNCSRVDGFIGPPFMSPQAFRDIVNYQPREGDLFVVTYPKSGTTWTQYIVHLIYNNAKSPDSSAEFYQENPFLEFFGVDSIKDPPRRGSLKTHFPFALQPYSPKAKYIYVARNPKDCCVSYYYHAKGHPFYQYEDGTFDHFFELFMVGEIDYEDYFDHVLSWYGHRSDENVLFLTFEELKRNTKNVVLRIAEFMGPEWRDTIVKDPHRLDKVIELSTPESMRKVFVKPMSITLLESEEDLSKYPSGLRHIVTEARKVVNIRDRKDKPNFQIIRRGVAGGWREHFSAEQNRRMNEKIEERLGGTELLEYWKKYSYV